MSTRLGSTRLRWLWPSVNTAENAKSATMFAFVSAMLCGAATLGFVLMAVLGVQFPSGGNLSTDALVDAFLFLLVAWGLWKQSRLAAWAGLGLYVFERAFMWSTVGMKNPVIAIILTLGFISGVRGTTALSRMKPSQPEEGAT